MADITLCYGEDCPLQEQCKRKKTEPDKNWQSWFVVAPYDTEKKECLYFWKEGES